MWDLIIIITILLLLQPGILTHHEQSMVFVYSVQVIQFAPLLFPLLLVLKFCFADHVTKRSKGAEDDSLLSGSRLLEEHSKFGPKRHVATI